MREIKFRAWDKILQKMYYPADLDYAETAILMQYTGLKDKNGKEIYEGDIVKRPLSKWYTLCKDIHQIKYGKHTVGFDGDLASTGPALGFYFFPYTDEDENMGCGEQLNWDDDIEILGNIYENRELLND